MMAATNNNILLEESALLALSTATYAGVGLSVSLISVPAVLASSDPLPSWRELYNNGKNLALSTIGISTLAGIRCYYKTEDWRFLLATGLSVAAPIFTLVFMKPTNDALFAIKDEVKGGQDDRIRGLIGKWSKLQWVRTGLGVGAFVVTLMIVHK